MVQNTGSTSLVLYRLSDQTDLICQKLPPGVMLHLLVWNSREKLIGIEFIEISELIQLIMVKVADFFN